MTCGSDTAFSHDRVWFLRHASGFTFLVSGLRLGCMSEKVRNTVIFVTSLPVLVDAIKFWSSQLFFFVFFLIIQEKKVYSVELTQISGARPHTLSLVWAKHITLSRKCCETKHSLIWEDRINAIEVIGCSAEICNPLSCHMNTVSDLQHTTPPSLPPTYTQQ